MLDTALPDTTEVNDATFMLEYLNILLAVLDQIYQECQWISVKNRTKEWNDVSSFTNYLISKWLINLTNENCDLVSTWNEAKSAISSFLFNF